MEVPSRDVAAKELENAEAEIPFHIKEWQVFERWLGWKKYQFSLSMLSESDDELRSVLQGRAKMCEEILKMGQYARKRAD